ncbi:MAG TPA: hypothetical protein DCL61_04770, partial [Cyanobacteria bacterium UBA12227]|nr:hypothetical protein [Cyanobacteria bacterium UBA12227]
YYLSQGRNFLESRDLAIASDAVVAGDGDTFSPDINSKILGTKIAGLERLGIASLILGMGEYQELHSDHPLVIDIFNKCRDNAWWIKLALGLGVSSIENPIEMCQYLLRNLLGLKLPRLRREKLKDGRRRWVYGCAAADFEKEPDKPKKLLLDDLGRAIPILDGREAVFEAWFERDVKTQETAATQAAAATQQQILLEENIRQGVGWIRDAIASQSIDYAQDIRSKLNEINQRWKNLGVKFKSAIWQQLTETEQKIWKILTDSNPNLMLLDIEQCLRWIREAIAANDPEFAQAINSTLSETAKAYPQAFREGVWGGLKEWERRAWKALLAGEKAGLPMVGTAQNPDTVSAEHRPRPANFSYTRDGRKKSQRASTPQPPAPVAVKVTSLGGLNTGDLCTLITTGDVVEVVGFVHGKAKVRYLQPLVGLADEAEVRLDWLKPVAAVA